MDLSRPRAPRLDPGVVRWIAARGRMARLVLAAAAGALATLAQAPVSQPLVLFLALPLLVWLIDATPGPRAAAGVGWAFGFGMFVTGLFWIGHAFLVDAEEFAWALPFAVTLLPAFLALYWAAAAALARALWSPGVGRVAVLAATITLAEYARGQLFTGFPWGLVGYAWLETPLIQAVAVAGPFGLTLLTLWLAALPLVSAAQGRWRPAMLALVGLAAMWGYGVWVLARPDPAPGPVVRLVQPNAELRLKRDPVARAEFERRLLAGSAAPADPALGAPAVVVWPESAVEFLPARDPAGRARIAAAARVPVILGALDGVARPGGGADWWNSLMVIAPDGSLAARYDKHHLVPFGEYMPVRPLMALLGLRQLADRGGFIPGPGPQTLSVPGVPPFAALICYETIFPDAIVARGPRPDWMVALTNDGWFGGWGGPQQHLAQARIRAIEQGLPMVRAAATGISAIIDARGRITSHLGLGAQGYLDGRLPGADFSTIYAKSGDFLALFFAVLIGIYGLGRAIFARGDEM